MLVIYAGSFGTVHLADWNGCVSYLSYRSLKMLQIIHFFKIFFCNSKFILLHICMITLQDVAVKILMEQDLHGERFKEFLQEVSASSLQSTLLLFTLVVPLASLDCLIRWQL